MSTVKKYRKLPVVVEAIQWTGHNQEELKSFAGINISFEKSLRMDDIKRGIEHPDRCEVWNHLEKDTINCPLNHYVIKGIRGEFYPHDPEVFAEVYEEVN